MALSAGIAGEGASGTAPMVGALHAAAAAGCYSGYLFLLRRHTSEEHSMGAVRDVSVSAALVGLIGGLAWGGIELTPGWESFGWLVALALIGQVIGWLLVAAALRALPSHVGSTLLLLQPVGAVAIGLVFLSERPSPAQFAGCTLVLGGVAAISLTATRRTASAR
ncbi:EamA family transporter [Actinomadura rubrisoli]|uniref:EamA family transporter n=1 Tax=Actinomadura rubrisoli TaxID=2530368 RepID=UPI001404810C|nr:EamA family transporter [Actinomadura rubrisoli]